MDKRVQAPQTRTFLVGKVRVYCVIPGDPRCAFLSAGTKGGQWSVLSEHVACNRLVEEM